MSKIFFLALATLFSIATSAQHTLQFNQALLINSSGGTVPANAVWKIVSLLPSSTIVSNSSPGYDVPGVGTFSITVNSQNIPVANLQATGSNGDYDFNYTYTGANGIALPIWLPANTTLAAGTNIQFISVLEFYVQ